MSRDIEVLTDADHCAMLKSTDFAVSSRASMLRKYVIVRRTRHCREPTNYWLWLYRSMNTWLTRVSGLVVHLGLMRVTTSRASEAMKVTGLIESHVSYPCCAVSNGLYAVQVIVVILLMCTSVLASQALDREKASRPLRYCSRCLLISGVVYCLQYTLNDFSCR